MNKDNRNLNYSNSLNHEFYLQSADIVAKEIIGCYFVRQLPNGEKLAGRIVETEAYLSEGDKASHSAPGPTPRNKAMFGQGGTLYVYMIYGIHHCINVVTEPEGIGSAVLIRALEPVEGLEIMMNNRKKYNIDSLCCGPGNVSCAMGLDLNDNARSLCHFDLFISKNGDIDPNEIVTTTRIGITKSAEFPLRFYLKNSLFVSGRKN